MSHKKARPVGSGRANNRPALDFRWAAESGSSTQNPHQRQALRRLRRQRLVERVCALGARAVFELVDELDRHLGIGDDLDRRLQRYADADPELLHAFGADRFAPLPTRRIWGQP
jgi:hypothetical protein